MGRSVLVPMRKLPPHTHIPVTQHFESNSPFAVVESLERGIEISHLGSIFVTENFGVKHAGARLKGVFSRFDSEAKPGASGAASFRQLLARFRPRVHSVYYRDEIGSISTFHLRTDLKKELLSELELEPRYPVLGGWQVTFTIGYGLPQEDFVFKTKDDLRYLNMTFGTPFINLVVEELTVKVVLPEGSMANSTFIAFTLDEEREVVYKFTSLAMLAEPLLLVAGLYAFFAASIAYTHLDESISKSSASYQAKAQK